MNEKLQDSTDALDIYMPIEISVVFVEEAKLVAVLSTLKLVPVTCTLGEGSKSSFFDTYSLSI